MRLARFAALVAVLALGTAGAEAAMYKWVDEHGTTHYGDNVPPRYANRAEGHGKSAPSLQKAAVANPAPSAEEDEKQKAEAKRQLERQRQDTALLATYASESEIELARARQLKRNQDTLQMATAGLGRSAAAEDRRKLDALMTQSRQETDNINARFDAQIARYRELTRADAGKTAAAAQPAPPAAR